MKKKIFFILTCIAPLFIFSQNENQLIQSYLNSNLTKLDITLQDASDWVIESKATSKTTKITNYYIKQRSNEIEIYHALSNVWVKDNQVVNVGNRFLKNCNQKTNTSIPQITVLQALNQAKNQLEINTNHTFALLNTSQTNSYIISNELNANTIKAKLVFQLMPNKQLVLAWDFIIDVPRQNHIWSARIDAVNGQLLEKNDLVISCQFDQDEAHSSCTEFHFDTFGFKETNSMLNVQSGSYRVLPFSTESPNHGPLQLITNPHNIQASPFGWHDTNGIPGAEFNITQGNNVHAFEDTNDVDDGASPDGGPGLIFDFPYLGTNTPAIGYVEAATTNLFYMNNIIHDVFYNYGFDEENGNFQQTNYSNLGTGNDYILAQSQDGGGINNANFGTPPDGENGRMQMYIWYRKAGADLITINSPASIAGSYTAFDNGLVFGSVDLPQAPNLLTANLVLVDDGVDEFADGCTSILNAAQVNGKIAVIKRGICTSVTKILNAQNAGALAVIIVNTQPGNFFIGGVGDQDITIPVISVKKDVGDFLLNEMVTSTLNVNLSEPFSDFVNVDGDFDNLVIAHEYGHGISNRLTGGKNTTSCLFNREQMGEGWSDWFGLMLQMKENDNADDRRGIGTFVINQPTDDDGIRTYPYSTNMSINPMTFGFTNTLAVPHGVGSVWATMLWDLSWAYVDKYGFDSNIYSGNGGNNKVLQLVVDALKLQPCFPSFVDGRDAIIAADQATTGGQDFCMVWEVFARRGLGVNALSGDNDSATDQVEDFTMPEPGPNCTALSNEAFENEALIRIHPNPMKDEFTITIPNYDGTLSFQIFDLNGRLLLDKKNETFSKEKTYSITTFTPGVYILKLSTDHKMHTQKIIIQ